MPDANSGMGRHREGRQERTEQPRQPGATGGKEDREHSPGEAREAALHRRGKTNQHTSDDRERPSEG
jgi:hypothetical protein